MFKHYKLKALLILLMIGSTFLAIAQKPTYTFTFKVYINEATAQYYGGHAAIQDSITKLFTRVNQYYNSESRFLATYNFVPSAFSYYSETGANQNVMNNLTFSAAETGYNYRLIVSRSPYGGSNANILSDYTVDTRSIRWALNAESEWGQNLFGPTPTKILCHEIGHSRGAYDMYAGDVTAANNQVYNDVSYNLSILSVMNTLYYQDANWDPYSIYCINSFAGNLPTATTWGNLFWSLFPNSFSIRAKDTNGNPLANVKVTLYGVRWLSTSINTADAFVYYTNAQGLVTFDGTNSANNPFHRSGTNIVSDFANFMVVTNLGDQGFYNWMNVYDVQNAKLNNQSYYLDYTFNATNAAPTVSITSPSNNASFTAPASVTINATAADTDGSISKVEFYNGSSLLGTSTSSPYTYTWSNVVTGTYSLTAKAYDNTNTTTTSSPVNITVGSSTGCAAPQYVAGTTYATNTVVQNNGHTYQCTVGGWCSSSAASYYAPGTGSAWQSAWNDLGICQSNQSPTVSLSAPANNATYTAPANVTLTATASDADGTISKVEFYNGTALLSTKTASPYTYSWTGVAAGSYNLTAKAYDNLNATTTSSVIHITVNSSTNQSPTVSLTAPANNATYTAPASVTITATASDADGTISKVEFYNGTTLLSTKTASPYTYAWISVAAGTYMLTAKAYDNLNAVTTSSAVSITVNAANQVPAVSLTAPANNATYTAPASVTITATATDADGTISKVEFYNGTTLLSTKTASPYTYAWGSVAAGTYTLTAKAYDNLNAVTTSSSITITVQSTGTCTAQQWSSTAAYNGGAVVQYLGVKYLANWWTQNQQPNLYSGAAGSGQPWTNQGTCNSRMSNAEEIANTSLTLVPNPADLFTSVTVTMPISDEVTVTVYDLLGKKIGEVYNGPLEAGEHEFYLNTASYTSGTYVIMMVGTQTGKSVKFVKR